MVSLITKESRTLRLSNWKNSIYVLGDEDRKKFAKRERVDARGDGGNAMLVP